MESQGYDSSEGLIKKKNGRSREQKRGQDKLTQEGKDAIQGPGSSFYENLML